MLIATQRRGLCAPVVVTGTGDDTTAVALSAELARLLEAGVITVVLDVRAAPDVERWAAGVADRFHVILAGLGGGLRVEPPWTHTVTHTVHHVLPRQRVVEPTPGDPPGPSSWFG